MRSNVKSLKISDGRESHGLVIYVAEERRRMIGFNDETRPGWEVYCPMPRENARRVRAVRFAQACDMQHAMIVRPRKPRAD